MILVLFLPTPESESESESAERVVNKFFIMMFFVMSFAKQKGKFNITNIIYKYLNKSTQGGKGSSKLHGPIQIIRIMPNSTKTEVKFDQTLRLQGKTEN